MKINFLYKLDIIATIEDAPSVPAQNDYIIINDEVYGVFYIKWCLDDNQIDVTLHSVTNPTHPG